MDAVTHIFVADEMGRTGITSKVREPFVSGGYVIPKTELPLLEKLWRDVKQEVCGSATYELKWSDFFTEPPKYPLLQSSPKVRLYTAMMILFGLFEKTSLLPLLYVCRKDRYLTATIPSDDLWTKSARKGTPIVNREFLFIAHIARFALFLHTKTGIGEIWHDNMGSPQDADRHQTVLQERQQDAVENPQIFSRPEHGKALLRIKPQVKFLDSSQSDAVQIADLLCGVLFRGASGEMDVLSVFADKFGRDAERNGLGIFRVE